jgi:large subunit ribosomal protein L15
MPLHRRLPKIGFSNKRFEKVYQIANVGDFESKGLAGEIGPAELAKAGLIRSATKPVKILGGGDLKISVTVRAHAFSGSATEKIQAAGGSAEAVKN